MRRLLPAAIAAVSFSAGLAAGWWLRPGDPPSGAAEPAVVARLERRVAELAAEVSARDAYIADLRRLPAAVPEPAPAAGAPAAPPTPGNW